MRAWDQLFNTDTRLRYFGTEGQIEHVWYIMKNLFRYAAHVAMKEALPHQYITGNLLILIRRRCQN